MEPVRICVVGGGRAGLVHGRNFAHFVAGATVTAVVEPVEEAGKAASAQLKARHFFSLQEALAHAAFDAVCIATPTYTHRDLVVQAARAGKHVFCEKPMALSVEEALEMIRVTREAGVVLQIGFMRRFDPEFMEARSLLEEGAIGEPILIRSTTRGPGLPPPWAWDARQSNGMLAEVNSHDFDAIRWLTGREYASVLARVQARKAREPRRKHPDFYDVAVVSVELEDGTLGVVEGACPVDYGYDARVEVLGTEGMLTIGSVAQGTLTRVDRQGKVLHQAFRSWRDRFREAYLAEAREFVACVRTGRTPRVTGVDGLRALEAVVAALRSIASGVPQRVIRHPV